MKTTVLFAAVIWISTASFAQTTVKSTESADVNATSGADLKTGAVTKTSSLAKQKAKQTGNYANAEKQTVKKDVKGDVNQIKKSTEQEDQISAGSGTSATAEASGKNNNSGKDASLHRQASLSANGAGNSSTNLKKDGKTVLQTSADETTKTGKKLEAETKATDNKVTPKAGTVSKSVKPKPVFVKMNTHVATASAIKIK
jgi:hypothetical protein